MIEFLAVVGAYSLLIFFVGILLLVALKMLGAGPN